MRSRLLATIGLVGLVGARRVLLNWGATKADCRSVLPGDALVPEPAVSVTRAVTVDAPAAEVWQWLVQIGQGRGGMYSYDWLENLFRLDIHSTDAIRPEWQRLAPGDPVVLVRPGWLGLREGYALTVDEVQAQRALVLRDDTWHSVWSFHVHPVGAHRCRLLSRSRAPRRPDPLGVAGQLLDPIAFVMTRRMLLGIKRRAEHHWVLSTARAGAADRPAAAPAQPSSAPAQPSAPPAHPSSAPAAPGAGPSRSSRDGSAIGS